MTENRREVFKGIFSSQCEILSGGFLRSDSNASMKLTGTDGPAFCLHLSFPYWFILQLLNWKCYFSLPDSVPGRLWRKVANMILHGWLCRKLSSSILCSFRDDCQPYSSGRKVTDSGKILLYFIFPYLTVAFTEPSSFIYTWQCTNIL